MKTKYMVYIMDENKEMEVQTVLDSYIDALFYANDNSQFQHQYIAKFTTMKILTNSKVQE